ncbi:MAG: hypothetical protein KGL57_02490 [Burkholderiales bacterium]|nr:hypothetical protein [Burkholderiales bacterium]
MLIALVVILASMMTFALRFVAHAQGTANLDIQSSRVRHAAEAAVEWQRYLLRKNGAGACALSSNLVIPLTSGNVTATIKCAPSLATEAGQPVHIYSFTATACWPAGPTGCSNNAPPSDYVEHQISTVAVCPNTVATDCSW